MARQTTHDGVELSDRQQTAMDDLGLIDDAVEDDALGALPDAALTDTMKEALS